MSESDYEDPAPRYTKAQNAHMAEHHDATLVNSPNHSDEKSLNVIEDDMRNLTIPATGNSGSDSSKTAPSQNAMSKFPATMKGYFKWDNRKTPIFHLGMAGKNSKLFAVSTFSNVSTNNPSVILYDGATHEDPILATFTASANKWDRMKPGTFHLPVRSGSFYKREIVALMTPQLQGKLGAWEPVWKFSAPITTDGTQKQRFEWRRSRAKEVERIATGDLYGWKLVRVSGPNRGSGGPRKQRDFGFTSDGLEIVAVFAHNSSNRMAKALRFAFMGTGLTGELGEVWEIMAVVSALQLWYCRSQEIITEREDTRPFDNQWPPAL
ncbi:hypothetical protein N7540_005948 [Penicillium herquei]|nr:hypothetical protein N7540_005948 [Penicillium herquei]